MPLTCKFIGRLSKSGAPISRPNIARKFRRLSARAAQRPISEPIFGSPRPNYLLTHERPHCCHLFSPSTIPNQSHLSNTQTRTHIERDTEPNGSTGLTSKQTSKKKRKSRTAFTHQQIYELERRFNSQKYLSPTDRDEIALSLNLTNAQVITWFQVGLLCIATREFDCIARSSTDLT